MSANHAFLNYLLSSNSLLTDEELEQMGEPSANFYDNDYLWDAYAPASLGGMALDLVVFGEALANRVGDEELGEEARRVVAELHSTFCDMFNKTIGLTS